MKELADILVVVITLCGFLGSIFIGIKFRRTLPVAEKKTDVKKEKEETERVVEAKKEQNRALSAEELADRFNKKREERKEGTS